jgi:hypothetical protein
MRYDNTPNSGALICALNRHTIYVFIPRAITFCTIPKVERIAEIRHCEMHSHSVAMLASVVGSFAASAPQADHDQKRLVTFGSAHFGSRSYRQSSHHHRR